MTDERSNVVALWMATVRDAVEKFKNASVEEQEIICVGLGQAPLIALCRFPKPALWGRGLALCTAGRWIKVVG